MPRDFLSKLMPPNSVSRSWIPNAARTQLRFRLDPSVGGCAGLDLSFLSEFARADCVNKACCLPASVVDPAKFACLKLLGNILERCDPLPVTCLSAFARFIR